MNRSLTRAINNRTKPYLRIIVTGTPETISQKLREAAAYAEHGFYHPQETFGPQDVFSHDGIVPRTDYCKGISRK